MPSPLDLWSHWNQPLTPGTVGPPKLIYGRAAIDQLRQEVSTHLLLWTSSINLRHQELSFLLKLDLWHDLSQEVLSLLAGWRHYFLGRRSQVLSEVESLPL